MRRILRVLALVGAVLPMGGCEYGASLLAGEAPAWGSTEAVRSLPGINGRLEWSGLQSEVQGRSTVVARTQEEWGQLWRRVAQDPPAPLPAGWMAVGVFAGLQNTGGHSVEILDAAPIRRAEFTAIERFVVTYRIVLPPAEGVAPQAQTSPWAIRLMRDTPTRVEFERVS